MKKVMSYLLSSMIIVITYTSLSFGYQVTIEGNKDTWINKPFPDNNYGSGYELKSWLSFVDPDWRYYMFVEFDVSPYAGKTISYAELRLYCYELGNYYSYVRAYRRLSAWDENTATWNNVNPTSDYTVTGRLTPFQSNTTGWHLYDATEMVNGWLNNTYPNYGLQLFGGSSSAVPTQYYSSENPNSLGPELVLFINDPPVPEPLTSISLLIACLGLLSRVSLRKSM